MKTVIIALALLSIATASWAFFGFHRPQGSAGVTPPTIPAQAILWENGDAVYWETGEFLIWE